MHRRRRHFCGNFGDNIFLKPWQAVRLVILDTFLQSALNETQKIAIWDTADVRAKSGFDGWASFITDQEHLL